jgi:hypothetical protein
MRFFTLLVLFLVILTVDRGLASPVPYLLNTIKGWISDKTENENDIMKRDVTDALPGHATESQGANSIADWNRCRVHGGSCRSIKQPEEADFSANDRKESHDVGSHESSMYLTTRQTINPISPLLNTPCVKALIAKYGQQDLNTLSFEDKQTLLKGIIDCVYGSVENTYRGRIGSRDSPDGPVPRVGVGERCTKEQLQNAYLATHWDYLDTPKKIMYWVILVHCLKSEPGSPIKPLRLRESRIPDPAQMDSLAKAHEKWEARGITTEGEDAFIRAFSECVDPPAPLEERSLATREVDGNHHVQDEDCMKEVTGSWTGDLSTKEDSEAYIIAVTGCIPPASQADSTIISSTTSSSLAKRKDCATSLQIYGIWGRSSAISWINHNKKLDRKRDDVAKLVGGMVDCLRGGVEWYHCTCTPRTHRSVMVSWFDLCWKQSFPWGGPGCSSENTCWGCARDLQLHVCP